MGNSRSLKRKITGAGETSREANRQSKKTSKAMMRPHGSPRLKACPTHGRHRQLWSVESLGWINEEDWDDTEQTRLGTALMNQIAAGLAETTELSAE